MIRSLISCLRLKYISLNFNCRSLTVSVEGNIGSGKTTLLQKIQDKLGSHVCIHNEPIHRWRNVAGHNLCRLMYDQPQRWGFTFQNFVQLTMAERHEKMAQMAFQTPNQLQLMERSLLSARHVFVENLYQKNLLSHLEYAVLSEFANHYFKRGAMDCIDVIVYLRVQPDKCLQRIRQRAREEEMSLQIESLAYLHNLHEQLLTGNRANWPKNLKLIPIICLDSNETINELLEKLNEWPKLNYKSN